MGDAAEHGWRGDQQMLTSKVIGNEQGAGHGGRAAHPAAARHHLRQEHRYEVCGLQLPTGACMPPGHYAMLGSCKDLGQTAVHTDLLQGNR